MAEPLTATCHKCNRTWPAEYVTFKDGTRHLRVKCRLHPGVYAPQDEARGRARQADAPPERSLADFR